MLLTAGSLPLMRPSNGFGGLKLGSKDCSNVTRDDSALSSPRPALTRKPDQHQML